MELQIILATPYVKTDVATNFSLITTNSILFLKTAVATELDDVVQKLQNSFFVTRRKEQKVLEINEWMNKWVNGGTKTTKKNTNDCK